MGWQRGTEPVSEYYYSFYERLLFTMGVPGWPSRINEDKYAPPVLYKLLPVKSIVGYLNQMWLKERPHCDTSSRNVSLITI